MRLVLKSPDSPTQTESPGGLCEAGRERASIGEIDTLWRLYPLCTPACCSFSTYEGSIENPIAQNMGRILPWIYSSSSNIPLTVVVEETSFGSCLLLQKYAHEVKAMTKRTMPAKDEATIILTLFCPYFGGTNWGDPSSAPLLMGVTREIQ